MTSPEDHWFVRREQRQVGPLSLEQLQELARRGVLQASDLIRKPDSETWVAAQEVPALLGPIAVGSIGAKGIVALDGPIAAKGIVALGGSVAPNDAVSNGDIKPPPLPEISPSPPPSPPPLPTPLPQVSNLEVSHLQPPLPGLPAEPLVPEMPSLETPNLETPSPETPSPETPRPDMPALSSLDDWATDEEIRQPNYFVRHWRGELPLHASFWFSGIVGLIPVAIVVTLISASRMLKDEFAPAWMLLAIVSAWLIAFAAVGWQVVGAWRSAGHYQRQRQPGGWGGIWGALAKVALAAAAVCTLFIFGTAGVAQVRDYYKIYAGDGRMGQHALRLTRDGRELEFSGGISLGVAKVRASPFIGAIAANGPSQLGRRTDRRSRSDRRTDQGERSGHLRRRQMRIRLHEHFSERAQSPDRARSEDRVSSARFSRLDGRRTRTRGRGRRGKAEAARRKRHICEARHRHAARRHVVSAGGRTAFGKDRHARRRSIGAEFSGPESIRPDVAGNGPAAPDHRPLLAGMNAAAGRCTRAACVLQHFALASAATASANTLYTGRAAV